MKNTSNIIQLVLLFLIGILILVTFFVRKLLDVRQENYDLWKIENETLFIYTPLEYPSPLENIKLIRFIRQRRGLGNWEGGIAIHQTDGRDWYFPFQGSSYYRRRVRITPKRTINYIIDEMIDALQKNNVPYEIEPIR